MPVGARHRRATDRLAVREGLMSVGAAGTVALSQRLAVREGPARGGRGSTSPPASPRRWRRPAGLGPAPAPHLAAVGHALRGSTPQGHHVRRDIELIYEGYLLRTAMAGPCRWLPTTSRPGCSPGTASTRAACAASPRAGMPTPSVCSPASWPPARTSARPARRSPAMTPCGRTRRRASRRARRGRCGVGRGALRRRRGRLPPARLPDVTAAVAAPAARLSRPIPLRCCAS